MKRGCAGTVAMLVLVAARAARADGDLPAPGAATTQTGSPAAPSCGGAGHPGIVLRASGLDGDLEAKITGQLRAALAGRGFELCPADRSSGAVAELDVSNGGGGGGGGGQGVSLSLSVRDQVTDKRVSREIDLRGIPDDGRALVIAEAADELLRASWAELLVADAPRPRRDVPAEVTRTLPALQGDAERPSHPAPADRAPIVELGVDAAIEHYGSGHTQLGPEISAGVFPLSRLGAVARLGIRSASSADSASGSVDPSAIAGAFGVLVAAFPREGRLGLDGGAELFVTRVHYEATALPGAHAQSNSGTAVHAAVVTRGWAVVARPLRATIGLSLGAPVHTVRAVANDVTIASVSGVLIGATLGLGGAW